MIKQTYEFEEMIPHMFSNKAEIFTALLQNRAARKSLQSKNPTDDDIALRDQMKNLGAQQFEQLKSRLGTLDLEGAQSEFDSAIKGGLLEIHRFHVMETENIGAA